MFRRLVSFDFDSHLPVNLSGLARNILRSKGDLLAAEGKHGEACVDTNICLIVVLRENTYYRRLDSRRIVIYFANAIRFNQFVIMPAGFTNTEAMLRDNGYEVREINNTECAKIDGGMSCSSLRF